MKRYRLLATAQIDGGIREPGYIFTLPDDVKPPHRAVHAHHGNDAPLKDEPLVEFLGDVEAPAPVSLEGIDEGAPDGTSAAPDKLSSIADVETTPHPNLLPAQGGEKERETAPAAEPGFD